MNSTDGRRLTLVTPWFPTPGRPHHGAFVVDWLKAVQPDPGSTTVLHLATAEPGDHAGVAQVRDDDLGTIHRVPVAVDPRAPRADAARAYAAALRAYLADAPEALLDAQVVHAHVGMPSGWAAAQSLRNDQRLVLTEHASYLPALLGDPAARRIYAQLVARCSAVLTVGEHQARMLRSAYPAHAARVTAVGNPLETARFEIRPTPQGRLHRWVAVANLVPGKGVDRVVDAFTTWRREPDDRLTIVGDGPMRDALVRRAADLGLGPAVVFAGAVPPSDVPGLLSGADVLVHLSSAETFGLAPLEALLAGVPVVSTASGGPTATLRDAVDRGQARLLPVSASADDVAAAVDVLATTTDGDAMRAVRSVLADRYDITSFGARIRAILHGEPTTTEEDVRRSVLLVGIGPADCRALDDAAVRSIELGARVGLATASAEEALAADRRITVIPVRHPRRAWSPSVVLLRAGAAVAGLVALLATYLARGPLRRLLGAASRRALAARLRLQARAMAVSTRRAVAFAERQPGDAARGVLASAAEFGPELVVHAGRPSGVVAQRIATQLGLGPDDVIEVAEALSRLLRAAGTGRP